MKSDSKDVVLDEPAGARGLQYEGLSIAVRWIIVSLDKKARRVHLFI